MVKMDQTHLNIKSSKNVMLLHLWSKYNKTSQEATSEKSTNRGAKQTTKSSQQCWNTAENWGEIKLRRMTRDGKQYH